MASASFLAIDRIVDVARQAAADAVHPGYGFLAENADFAEACGNAGIAFIGPSPAVIRAMGNKTRAKEIAIAAGVPVIPGFSADGLSDDDIAARVAQTGLPLLLKAAAGGGGKGMRIVRHAEDLPAALAAARRESKAAFGDDSLLVERYIENPRHIEVQILGDRHGNLVHCFERECSIQRRYQKVIEEAPSPAVDAGLRSRMTDAALSLARRLDYSSAGTVEFVVDPAGDFYFLEVNTRLQVEHPVTEAITGLDLVRLQIQVAENRPLPFVQSDLRIQGHAIECRLCAEDPASDFLPATGTIARWQAPSLEGVRVDSGVTSGSEVSIYYDSLIAKVIAHADTREAAVRRLAYALDQTQVHGLRCNRAFLARVLREPEFASAAIDTHYLARHPELACADAEQSRIDERHAIAAALWQQSMRRRSAAILPMLPSGWRNNPSQAQHVAYAAGEQVAAVGYRMHGATRATVEVGAVRHRVEIVAIAADAITLEMEAVQRRYTVTAVANEIYVQSPLGFSMLVEQPRFPDTGLDSLAGGCQAPMPGKILAVRVQAGDRVLRGQELAVLEAMKMEHSVTAPHDGMVLEARVEPGQQVNTGDILVVLDDA